MQADREPRAQFIRWGAIIFIVCIALYALFQARHLIEGPIITIDTPRNGASVARASIDIIGTTKNVTRIRLNDRSIFITENGAFSEKLLLPMGYTIMKLEAEDRFGRSTQELLHVVRY
jgi:hypothetical protein